VLVRYRGAVYAFEIKSATGKQTDAQLDTQWPVIRSIEDALFELGVR
jgi:hypothetical protein